MFLGLLVNLYDIQDSEVLGLWNSIQDAKNGIIDHLGCDHDDVEWSQGSNGLTGSDGEIDGESYLIIQIS